MNMLSVDIVISITSQYLLFRSHFKRDGSILTTFYVGQLHSRINYINISGTSLYTLIATLIQAIKKS